MSTLTDYSSGKEVSLTGKILSPKINTLTVITAWEHAQLEGKTFQASYFDTTGITAGTSYFYFARNTSTDKIARVRPPQFNPGTFLFQFIKESALMKLGGVVTAPTELDAIALPTWNNGGTNTAALKLYFESGLGTWTWDESAAVQATKRYISIMAQPLPFESYSAQIPPGEGFWAIFTNYGAAKLPYNFNIEWSELLIA